MLPKSTKIEAKRFLAAQFERNRLLWVSPSEEDSEESIDRSHEDSAEIEPVVAGSAETPLIQLTREEAFMRWESGAPEAVATIPVSGVIDDPFPEYADIISFKESICHCEKCPLGKTRTKFVFGVGDPEADLVLVGEAPGADEDLKGEPFVGRAGQLLDKILDAVGLHRNKRVYICNILKCRPPNNRDPKTDEVEKCEPYLVKQLQLLKPKLILALGRVAAQTLLKTTRSLTSLRGEVHDYHGVPMLVTFHPAALLRNPNWKRPAWEDVQKMKNMLDEQALK